MSSFNLFSNQAGTLATVAVDASLNPRPASAQAAVSSNPAVLTVAPNPGFPDQFAVRGQGAGKTGSVTVTVTGINAINAPFSTDFSFVVTDAPPPADVAVAFTATLINVVNE